jgi:hypothetical protein
MRTHSLHPGRHSGRHSARRLSRLAAVACLPLGLGSVGLALLARPAAVHAARSKETEKERVRKEQARQFFEEGTTHYNLREFEQAIESFQNAYKSVPNAAFLFNIAQAHRMAGHLSDAIGFYNNYLRLMPDAANADEVKRFIAELEASKKAAAEVPKLPPLPPPQPVLEPRSKHNFWSRMNRFGTDYVLTGAGFRSYLGFTVYGVGMYVEEEPARRAYPKLVQKAGGSDLNLLRARDLAQNFVVLGEFDKLGLMYFVRDVGADKIRDAYRGLLQDNLKPSANPQLRQQTEDFLAMFNRDMKTGEELVVGTKTDGTIFVAVGSIKKDGPKSPTLAIDLWNLWLGNKPLSKELKQGLVERIQALGEAAADPAAPAAKGAPAR